MEENEPTPKPKSPYLRRPVQFNVRMNEKEYSKFRSMAKKKGVSMTDYARFKILDIPFEQL